MTPKEREAIIVHIESDLDEEDQGVGGVAPSTPTPGRKRPHSIESEDGDSDTLSSKVCVCCVCTYVCMYVCMYVCTCVYMYVCMYVCSMYTRPSIIAHVVLQDSRCVETPRPKRNKVVRTLDSDISGLFVVEGEVGGVACCSLVECCPAEDDYVPTSGGESDGESGAEKSGVEEALESDNEEGEEEGEEPVTLPKKVIFIRLVHSWHSVKFSFCTFSPFC